MDESSSAELDTSENTEQQRQQTAIPPKSNPDLGDHDEKHLVRS
jgi:hypothetical protein